MNAAAVLFGPATVRGPCPVRGDVVKAALTCLDDDEMVLDDRRVSVDAVVGELIGAAVGGDRLNGEAVLVCPGWWPSSRVELIRAAARTVSAEAVVVQRPELCRHVRPDADVVVEVADEFVVAATTQSVLVVAPRTEEVADTVAAALGEPASVVIDAPGGVVGARAVAIQVAARLRRCGDVEIVGDTQLLRLAGTAVADPPPRRARWMAAALVPVLITAAVYALHHEKQDISTVSITEGRVAVTVPAGWEVERITAGTGSRRVQVTEPGGRRAVLIVQSPAEADMTATAATLAAVLQREDPRIFVDFQTMVERGGRSVVSYTEIREGRQVDWAVFLDDGMRIAIGCQCSPGQSMRQLCDDTIASAHAVP